MKKTTKLIITILWIMFIFANSLQTGDKSGEMSGQIVTFVYDILLKLKINIDVNTLSIIVRKAAHMTEFCILSILIFITLLEYIRDKKYFLLYLFLLPLIIAICDEAIQTFIKDRSGNLIDCLIDYVGSIIGLGLMFLINHKKVKKNDIEVTK